MRWATELCWAFRCGARGSDSLLLLLLPVYFLRSGVDLALKRGVLK